MVMTFSYDQVSEVSVQANGIPAQYGRTTSAIINQATRSGGNRFKGNASFSHLDPFFQTQALGAAFPPTMHYNQFAAAIGGVFSVALSVAFPSRRTRPGVTWQPALWSPDFPRARAREGAPSRPSGRWSHPLNIARSERHTM